MRVNSKGIDMAELPRIVAKAHEHDVRVYVTLNAIIYDSEIEMMQRLLQDIKDAGADAVICWDPSVITAARSIDIPIHISTQASVSNTRAAQVYTDLGAERIVLARELTLEQIKAIKEQTDAEIEVFAHGAMCVSVSGRCFMSQFLNGRSANRGDCLQPCRREYRIRDVETGDELDISNGFVMSPKDICTLPILDQLCDAGIDVLKIEGRNRSPEYIKTVVQAYRTALDAIADGSYGKELVEQLMDDVKRVYNRGFSTGFFLGRPGAESWTDQYGSKATQRKQYVGRILNYYPKAHVAYVQIESEPLAVGDTIQIHGPTTGIVDAQVEELRDGEG
jgi:putative protease